MSKITYLVPDIACQKCAATIATSLSESYDDVSIDVGAKSVTVELEPSQEAAFKSEMDEIGFPVVSELARER
jgi:copper chaperone CopZ